jgi:hypothetical protein
MNADHADTRNSHLDLELLIAWAADQPVSEWAREHLGRCEQCQREADRWNLVAEGVRGLAAAAPGTAQPARTRRSRRRRISRPWRHAILVASSAAAALVLFLGVGELAGFVQVDLNPFGPSTSTDTVLAAVTGCPQVEQAEGTLEQVNGSSLVIKAATGQLLTVTTTATTFISMSGPLLGDITDGASVVVRGSGSDGVIKADIVTVGQPFSSVSPPGFVMVGGTVSDAGPAGFTLVTAGGTRIPVSTSSLTLVVIPHATPGQLPAGGAIFAVGQAGSDGALAARALAAVYQFQAGPHPSASLRVRDCSTRSIDDALGAISARPAPGG